MPVLAFLSDALLIAGTAALATWCWILGRRLRAIDATATTPVPAIPSEAVSRLEARMAELDAALATSASRASDHAARVDAANRAADDRIGRMEMLLASLEDIEEEHADRLLQDEGLRVRAEADAPDESLPSFRAARHAASGGRF